MKSHLVFAVAGLLGFSSLAVADTVTPFDRPVEFYNLQYPGTVSGEVTTYLSADSKDFSVRLQGSFPNGVESVGKTFKVNGDEITVLVFANANGTNVVTRFDVSLAIESLALGRTYKIYAVKGMDDVVNPERVLLGEF